MCILCIFFSLRVSARDGRINTLTASLNEWQAAAASESEARLKLQKQLDETSQTALASVAEADAMLKAREEENQRLRVLLVDAARETQAASEGSDIMHTAFAAVSCDFSNKLLTRSITAMAAVPKAFETAANIRIRAMSFLNRRQHLHQISAAFSGIFIAVLGEKLYCVL